MPETDGVKECAHCGAALADEQLICASCGEVQKRSRSVRCRQCGTVGSKSQQVCAACGEPLRGSRIWPALITLAILSGLLLALVLAAALWPHGLGGTRQPATVSTEPIASEVAATPTGAPSHTPVPSTTPRPSRTPAATPTSSPTPTATQTRSPTPTNTATPSSSPTPTPTSTATPTSSPTPTPLSLIHISEPTRLKTRSRMPSSA